MRDPYDVLGVSKTASEAEVKSAFRKLAKKLHRDRKQPIPRPRNAFPRSTMPTKSWRQGEAGQFDSARSARTASRASRASRASAPVVPAASARAGRAAVPAISAGRPAGADGDPFANEDVLNEISGRFAREGGGAGASAGTVRAPARGDDVQAVAAVTLEQLVRGEKARVDLRHRQDPRRRPSRPAPRPGRRSAFAARASPACSAARRATP